MKRMNRLLTALLLAAAALTATFGLAACKENEPAPHEHSFATEWSHDETQHWHAATCEHKEEKGSAAAHTMKDGKCTVCGWTDPNYEPPHVHEFDEKKWEYDATQHWHPATCGHPEEKGSAAAHTMQEGKCTVCGWTDPDYEPPHVHEFDEKTWEYDATQHWHPATCGHPEEKGSAAAHTMQDGKCTVCGWTDPNYEPPHVHEFDEKTWEHDATQHWHPATCGHPEEKGSAAPHTPTDDTCTVCGYNPNATDKLEFKSLKLVVWGFEWGPAYNKVVLEFDGNVSGYDKTTFSVALELAGWTGTTKSPRTVLDVYASDAMGNRKDGDSQYLTIEFAAKCNEASPFVYQTMNNWDESIPPVFVQIAEGKSLKVGKKLITAGKEVETTPLKSDRIVPQTASWKKDTVTEGSYTLTRASWAPQGADTDAGKNPLVIWLHGAGEGGTDIDIALLGNEVTGLTTENTTNIQHHFATDGLKGAYVLAVQTPTMWMDDGTGQYNNTGTGKQESCYTAALWKAITSYVEGNPDVDTNRIYLGGCSNGGYMTMNMMFEHGDYFAAFYPICEAYMNSRISDEMIAGIKDYNIWFLLSADDKTVDPTQCEFPTFMRLLGSEAKNVHMMLTEHVQGTDDPTVNQFWTGNPVGCYDGHWSWIYAFNDQVKHEFPNSKITEQSQLIPANCIKETDMWDWMATQRKGENHAPTTPDPDLPATPTPGPGGDTEPVNGTVFEFENAVLKDGSSPVTVETGPVYGGTETVTNIGYFHSGASATFTITASKECDVTITLSASSAVMDMSQMDWQTSAGLKMAAIDLSKNEYFTFTVNGQQATFTGILPGTDNASFSDPLCYKHMGTGTVKVHLNAGENVLKFETNPNNGSGINMDKITIDAEATLTWTPTDNSSRKA